MKKILSILIAISIVFCTDIVVFAADDKPEVSRVNSSLPDITFELKGNYDDDENISVTLDGEQLSVKNAESYNDDMSKEVFVLVDISTSMSQPYLNSLKSSIISFAKSFDDSDKFVLVTFGKEVKTKLKGSESDSKITDIVNSITCDSDGTTFYKALSSVYNDAQKDNDFDRQYVVVISDGANYAKAESSQRQVEDDFGSHRLPVYGLCQDVYNQDQKAVDQFSDISSLSGGEFKMFTPDTAKDRWSSLISDCDDVTLVSAKSDNNKILSNVILAVDINGKKSETKLSLLQSKKDTESPKIESLKYDKNKKCINLKFSEKVLNANSIDNYTITRNGKKVKIDRIDSSGSSTDNVNIYIKDGIYSGEYSVSVKGITDLSVEKNEVEKTPQKTDIKTTPVFVKYIKSLWWIVIPIIFFAVLIVILLCLKKKKKVKKIKELFETQVEEEVVEVKHVDVVQQHVKTIPSKNIELYIDTPDGLTKRIKCNVTSSVIIGRADICDVYLDDVKMSRQHFAIVYNKEMLVIRDLGTTNGTYVNGVKVTSQQVLKSNDKIFAGTSNITVCFK